MKTLKLENKNQIFNINKINKIDEIKEKNEFLEKKTNLFNKNIKILSSLSNLKENNNIIKKFNNDFINFNFFDNNNNNNNNTFNEEFENFTCNSYNESNNIIPLKYNTKENYKIQKNNDFYDNFFNNNFLEIENNSDSFSFYENETLSTKKHFFSNNINNNKNNEKINNNFKCEHKNCAQKFKTLKQKINHHFKMNPECKKDVINILNNIYKLKKIINKLIKKGFVLKNDFIIKKYNNIFNIILHQEYAQNILGLNFYQN